MPFRAPRPRSSRQPINSSRECPQPRLLALLPLGPRHSCRAAMPGPACHPSTWWQSQSPSPQPSCARRSGSTCSSCWPNMRRTPAKSCQPVAAALAGHRQQQRLLARACLQWRALGATRGAERATSPMRCCMRPTRAEGQAALGCALHLSSSPSAWRPAQTNAHGTGADAVHAVLLGGAWLSQLGWAGFRVYSPWWQGGLPSSSCGAHCRRVRGGLGSAVTPCSHKFIMTLYRPST
jgi:hypothetical protein